MRGPLCIHAHMFSWQLMAPPLDSLWALQLIPRHVNSVSSLTRQELFSYLQVSLAKQCQQKRGAVVSCENLIWRDIQYLLTRRNKTRRYSVLWHNLQLRAQPQSAVDMNDYDVYQTQIACKIICHLANSHKVCLCCVRCGRSRPGSLLFGLRLFL